MNCPKCGNRLPDDMDFCPRCGAAVTGTVPEPVSAVKTAAPFPSEKRPGPQPERQSRAPLIAAVAVLVLALALSGTLIARKLGGSGAPAEQAAEVPAEVPTAEPAAEPTAEPTADPTLTEQGDGVVGAGNLGAGGLACRVGDESFYSQITIMGTASLTVMQPAGGAYTQTSVLDGSFNSLTAFQDQLCCVRYDDDVSLDRLVLVDPVTREQTVLFSGGCIRVIGQCGGLLYFTVDVDMADTERWLWHTDGRSEPVRHQVTGAVLAAEEGIYTLEDGRLRLVAPDGRTLDNFPVLADQTVDLVLMSTGRRLFVYSSQSGMICVDRVTGAAQTADQLLRDRGVDMSERQVTAVNSIGRRLLLGAYTPGTAAFELYSLEEDGSARSLVQTEGSMDMYVLDEEHVLLRDLWTTAWQVVVAA